MDAWPLRQPSARLGGAGRAVGRTPRQRGAEGPGEPHPPGPASHPGHAYPLGVHRVGPKPWNMVGTPPGGVRSDWGAGVPGYSLAGAERWGGFAPREGTGALPLPPCGPGGAGCLRHRRAGGAALRHGGGCLPRHPAPGSGPVHSPERRRGTGASYRSAHHPDGHQAGGGTGPCRAGRGQRAGAGVRAHDLRQDSPRREGRLGESAAAARNESHGHRHRGVRRGPVHRDSSPARNALRTEQQLNER